MGRKKKTRSAEQQEQRYANQRERARAIQAEMSWAGRDIGPVPPIANLARRKRCRKSLRLFCETYNPDAFTLGWSDDHLRAIARLEEAATHGALYAFAMARGSGKSTLARHAALWAVSYRLCRYVYLIGANASKAEDSLAALRMYIRFLPEYAADFPEISHAVQKLGGIANRASGQLCLGQPTMIEWGKDRIILPSVPPPPNWPKRGAEWKLRADGMVPTAGSVVGVSGLTGDGIRGSLLTLTTGESIRPDLVLLDDPQTDESARSASQNASREELISGAVLGMAGPGKTISAVMPCTVIRPGDMVDRILDRAKHPLWRGERTKLMTSMPTNMGAWDAYFEVYRHCAQKEPPDFAEANEHYLLHREVLDAGAVPSWPARKLPWEVSAVQHALHLYCRDPRAFAAEYQNDPVVDEVDDDLLTADEIAAKTNGLPRGKVPLWAVRLTAFIDVQKDMLFWAVCAWDDLFTGHVVDYGTFPEQRRQYFSLRDANPTLADATAVPGLEAQIYRGLSMLVGHLLERSFEREDGQTLKIERLLVDANWQSETVKQWIRQANLGSVLPAHGRFFGPTAKSITEFVKKPGERKGHHWIVSKHVLFDSNVWKSFLQYRLATPQPSKGCLTLWGDRPHPHRLFSEHLTSEKREKVEARSRVIDVWDLIPGRENHWLDCLVGCTVAASIQGCALETLPNDKPREKKKVSFRDMQKQAQSSRF